MTLKAIQKALADHGHDPGPIDGIWGRRTQAAVEQLIVVKGRRGGPDAPHPVTELPWMAEAKRMLGRHEGRDNGFLSRWLRSDGRTLGDPAKLPWCGDFVETCVRLGLPSEPFPGALGENPYWARNWALLGTATPPTYGAVLVFERGSGGHVGFAVGEDGAYYQVLGGNQSNAVTVARIAKSRLLAARWPTTWPAGPVHLPKLSGNAVTTNEI